ncbi:guanine deaminase [Acinetobacter lwoffii]|uniref:Guanine deaminase n=1 Tax=Acinetobacter lwoffii NCTC 5866 = CIP 64.10 = NIPH 512 TaxID=981327 RepID=A0ABP2ZFH8_ACILW|nr:MULTISPECIES: guanine deaminase [Acinetobacter]ENU15325.1 guanine deaminase [Acinetobacter sp. CIP A162]ESJ94473.1 guanine deaminase [Acinetobacter lwoffii NCTC 5866 = CIP 64.10 = NIPH 512]QXB41716.1 guanine deaminase [Acinetobacter lwoffii]SUU33950.1 guanine deaminase [Acinetobacter lwoffii]VFQ35742.1 guanine deaminase [Acinetobacter lwoffii]
MSSVIATTAIRGRFLDIQNTVAQARDIHDQVRYVEDGLVIIHEGKIQWFGPWREGHSRLPTDLELQHYPDQLIVPGFIDTHIHFPQTEMVGAYGEQLLEWLNTYTFPTEIQFQDASYSEKIAEFFVQELLKNGTTTALVFCTVHPESVDALFNAATTRNMRLIAGKVLMDRHAPEALTDTAETAYIDSKALIEKWHGQGRNLYAITPRFAPTSTPEQLQKAGQLKAEYPDVYVHTHLSENKNEIAWVKELFPEREGYLDVYHHYGLTGSKSVFAHCVHLEDEEWDCMHQTDSAIAFCPTSNLFLGSGLFPLKKTWDKGVKVGLGTDIGAGTSFNQLQTLNEAYKVQQLQGEKLSAFEALYHATLGGAKALSLDDRLGNFNIGKEADFVVLNLNATALQQLRQSRAKNIEDAFFALTMLGDDRNIAATYVYGAAVYVKAAASE